MSHLVPLQTLKHPESFKCEIWKLYLIKQVHTHTHKGTKISLETGRKGAEQLSIASCNFRFLFGIDAAIWSRECAWKSKAKLHIRGLSNTRYDIRAGPWVWLVRLSYQSRTIFVPFSYIIGWKISIMSSMDFLLFNAIPKMLINVECSLSVCIIFIYFRN